MSSPQTVMLIWSDPNANHNKFYEVTMGDDQVVHARWGRVGANGQHGTKGSGQMAFDRAVAAKKAKGYTEVELAGSQASNASLAKGALAEASRKELAGINPILTTLVDRLVRINAHNIKAASGGQIVVTDGAVSTPLGVLSLNAVRTARDKLIDMRDHGYSASQVGDYLRLVPQTVPRERGWGERFFHEHTSFGDQLGLLDQLEQSVQYVDSQSKATTPDDLFRYRLKVVKSRTVTADLRTWFESTINRSHASSGARIKRIYELSDNRRAADIAATATKVGNTRRMWHGSRAANVLSILSSGLIVPPSNAAHTTGRMFGDGVYLSEQSTKSLNYSRGGVWSSGVDRQFFMFAADVSMGREFWPNRDNPHVSAFGRARCCTQARQSGKFDSVNVKAGTCGVRNHEAVVWNPDQINMRYLIEFEG